MKKGEKMLWSAIRRRMRGPKCKHILYYACRSLGEKSTIAKELTLYVTGLEDGIKKLLLAKDYELWGLRKKIEELERR